MNSPESSESPAAPWQKRDDLPARGGLRFEVVSGLEIGPALDLDLAVGQDVGAPSPAPGLREREPGEAQIRESFEFYRAIFASLFAHTAVLDRRGIIVATNDSWDRFALDNGGPEALAVAGVGVSYPEVCRRGEAPEVLEGIELVLGGVSDHYRVEYPCHSPTEFRWYQMDVVPLRRASGGAVVVHRDITAQKHAEVELERLRMDIWHAHRVAQAGAISASLAHELNQPLAAILSNAQAGLRLMARAEPDLEEIRAILADIVSDDKRAAAVIVGLRAMLRRKKTHRETLDLAQTIREVLLLARSELLVRDIDVQLGIESGFMLSADRAQIQQVVLNLVMNAIEAMEMLPAERRRLAISLTRSGADALLAVRDHGEGISSEQQHNVYDAFWTTKPQGMGIGLPVCRSIIESHGGQLWFENNPDHGVTFFVSLPLNAAG